MASTTTTTLENSPAFELLTAPQPTLNHGRSITNEPTLDSPPRRLFDSVSTSNVTPTSKFLIIALIVSINVVQFISNFVTVCGGLALSKALGRPAGAGQANWMAASYSLTQGAFVLITGRLGSIYGHQHLAIIGSLLFAAFSLANAFCTSYDSFIAVRALTGIGGGAFMPNAVATITTMTPPGKSRNLTLGFFAASPPIGGVIGGLLAGVFIELTEWKWLFVLMAGVSAALTGWLMFLFPKEVPIDPRGKIDYIGAFLGLGGLILFNVVWNQAPAVGWTAPYEIGCLIISIFFFAAFFIWEKKYAKEPIMPLNLFRAPSFGALIVVVLITYMGFGISIWYWVSWQQVLRNVSVLQTGIYVIPFGFGSVASVALAAFLVPRVAAEWILGAGVATVIVSNIIMATMPIRQTYWAQMFPSILLSSFCPDLVFVAAQLVASNSVSRRHQGAASSLVGTLNLYGNSLGLGFAGTIETQIAGGDHVNAEELVKGYKAALYFGAALAVAGLLLNFAFVRMPKDQRSGWDDELEQEDGVDTVTRASATAVETRA